MTPQLAGAWHLHAASMPLELDAGLPSLATYTRVAMLRALRRLVLHHALDLRGRSGGGGGGGAPSEVELAGALADALVPSVPCFKPHWRAMARAVLHLLDAGLEAALDAAPRAYHEALGVVARDALYPIS